MQQEQLTLCGVPGDTVIIKPHARWLAIDFRQIWQFRDLLMAFAWRDIRLRYRQTFLGVAWVLLQPLLGAAIFTVVFGMIAKMPSHGTPYFIISYSGLIGWTLFSTGLVRISGCLVANAELIRKVFFPRILLPLGVAPCLLLDLLVGGSFMALLMAYCGIRPGVGLLLFPVAVAALLAMAIGFGLIAASLAVRYRDVQYILPLFVQMLMYASPVGYSAAAVPTRILPFYEVNPLVGPLEAMRFSLLGTGHFAIDNLVYSIATSLVLLIVGLAVFRRAERWFADVI